jgi:hypothetical protein
VRVWLIPAALLLGVMVGGCERTEARAQPRGVVDSLVPIEEALRRFRRDLPRPEELGDAAGSREELVRALVRSLEARDTARLRALALQVDEFAWLYYPTTRFSKPPYELPPELMWFQIQGQSAQGASRLLAQRAGMPLRYLGHACDSVRTEGENHLYGHCAVRHVTAAGDTVAERLFGLILERGGRFKYVTYANELD